MESFFKHRLEINKNPICPSASKHRSVGSLPRFDSENDTKDESSNNNSTTETLLNAEAEGYRVAIIKERDVVTQIQITCSCGKFFTLNCQYEQQEENA